MRSPFDYAVVRVVPHVEREEFVNAGVIVFSATCDFLAARFALDGARLRSLAPGVDLALVTRHLMAIPRICAGGPLSGPIGKLPIRERWHWLVSPRSTIVQLSAAHVGLGQVNDALLDRLLDALVRPAGAQRAASRGRSTLDDPNEW